MKTKVTFLLTLVSLLVLSFGFSAFAQTTPNAGQKKKTLPPFSWVSPAPAQRITYQKLPADNLKHATFKSPLMGIEVGYHIYLPTAYADSNKRLPVVYHLHGGRPGSESKSIALTKFIHQHIESGAIAPTIYVFPNGGPLSWYDVAEKKNSMGESVFVKELIPHIDATYRTLAKREGRGIEGFSQGGRGTTRISFKHPELFGSTAPGGSGYEPEMRIRDNDGWESEKLRILPLGNNCWDLAKTYAAQKDAPKLTPLLWVGTKGFNYDYNLKFADYLKELGIPHQMIVVEGADHSATKIYEAKGLELMRFHQMNFGRLAPPTTTTRK